MKTKTFAIVVAVLVGAFLTISGTIMAFKGITQTGTIDIKSALVSGKIETGSLGLLFAFLGVLLLAAAVAKKREKKTTLKLKSDEDEFDWSQWESGDPNVHLYEAVFPKEEKPARFKKEPIVDWLSEETATEIVDNYLQKELHKRCASLLKSELKYIRRDDDETSSSILQVVDKSFATATESPSTELSEPMEWTTENTVLQDMMFMVESSVEGYFMNKKRIFAGWDKYPCCYPPAHNELAEWLVGIEKAWNKRLIILKESLEKMDFAQEAHSIYRKLDLSNPT